MSGLDIPISGRDDDDPEDVTTVACAELKVPSDPTDAAIRVVLSCNADGMIHVKVMDLGTHLSLGEFEVDRDSTLSRALREHQSRRTDDMGDPS